MGDYSKSDILDYKKSVLEYLYYLYEKEIIDYLKKSAYILNVKVEEAIDLFSCFEKTNENDVLTNIYICVPKPYNINSSRIFVHEFKHGIDMYPYLGHKLNDIVESKREDFEKRAQEEEIKFENYFVKKYSK